MRPRTPRRRWLRRLLLALALGLGVFFGLRALLQPERLGAFLLQQARDVTGLRLETTSPARLGLWPDLHLELQGLSARDSDDATPLLQAERIEAALPWSALRDRSFTLRRLRLHGAALDLAALQAWQARRSNAGPPPPLRLPQLDAALTVESSRIIGDGWRIEALSLALPHWREGVATRIDVAGRFERDDAAPLPFTLGFDTTASVGIEHLRLDPVELVAALSADASTPITLRGSMQLDQRQHLDLVLDGGMPGWPSGWPALPLPPADAGALQLHLQYRGSIGLDGDATLRIARGDERIEAQLHGDALLDWFDAEPRDRLPPLRGSAAATRLRFGSTTLHGVTLRIDGAQPGDEDDDNEDRDDEDRSD